MCLNLLGIYVNLFTQKLHNNSNYRSRFSSAEFYDKKLQSTWRKCCMAQGAEYMEAVEFVDCYCFVFIIVFIAKLN